MPWPRFTILQLLLLAALCALIVGLATASWRSNPWGTHPQPVGQSRLVECAILTLGLVGWGIAWGVVARRLHPVSAHFPAPVELKIVWGLFIIGGLVTVTVPTAVLVIQGPLVWPGMYYVLIVGLALIAAGAGRRTRDLDRVPILQMINLVACDWVNFILGLVCQSLLRRPHVQCYLHQVEAAHAACANSPAGAQATVKVPSRRTYPPG